MAGLVSRSDTEGTEGRKNDWKGGRKTPLVSGHTEEGTYACSQVALVCQETDLGSTGRSILYCRMPPHNATGPPNSHQTRSHKTSPPPHPTPPEWPLLVVPGTARARSQVLPGLAEGRGTSELGPRASRRRLGRRGVEGSAHSWGRGRPECPAYRPGSSQRVSNNLSPSGAGTAPSCGSGGEPNSPVTGTWLHRRWGPAQTRPRPQSLSTLPFQNCRRHRPQIPRTKQAPRATYADDLDARLCALFFRFHKQDLTGEPFLPVAHTSPEFRCPEPT